MAEPATRREIEAGKGGAKPPSQTPRVVVVGNLTLDDVVLPDGATRMSAVGGNCVYAALAARLWEPRVGIVTRRGADFPEVHLETLRRLGIATAGVVDIAGPTVRNWVVYEEDGRRRWLHRTPPERPLEVAVHPEDVPADWLAFAEAPVVHIAAMPLPTAEAIVARVRAESPRVRITLDTHEDWVAGHQDRLLRLAALVHAFLPSREELADLVGYDDPPRALAELAGLPTPAIVVKMGAEGCLVWDRRARASTQVGVSPGPVVDVTGAGDAFCGGFAAGLARGLTPVQAAVRGAVSAGFAVADFSSVHVTSVKPADAEGRLTTASPSVESFELAPPPRPPEPAEDVRAIEVMRREIDTIPELLASQSGELREVLSDLAAGLCGGGVERLVLTGCGDSMFAGQAATLAFHRAAGLETQPVHAMELARYRVRYLPERTAVVCISYSGEVGRTIEAAAQARRFGHRVIALTGRVEGRLANEADEVVLLDVPTLGLSPGTSSYVAMLAALFELALCMGERRGRDVTRARTALAAAPELARATLDASLEPALRVARRLSGSRWVCFVGAGPNEASARFGAAKLFEGPQVLATATNLEEWAHEEYFVTGAGAPVVAVVPAGASFDRAREILDEIAFVGADAILVTDAAVPLARTSLLPLAAGLPEEFTPLLAALPLSLVAFHLAEAAGKRSHNFSSEQAEREHYATIHRDTRGEPA